jgi:serine O-acetyltransferase
MRSGAVSERRIVISMWERFRRKKSAEPTLTSVGQHPEVEAHFETPEGRAELEAYFGTKEGKRALADAMARAIAERQPLLGEAFAIDVATYASLQMGPLEVKSGLPLLKEAVVVAWKTDAFLSLLLYRVRVRLMVHRVPLLPSLLHRLCMILAQMNIGENVVIRPGVYFPHGQVVVGGNVEIGTGCSIAPWVTLGRNGTDELDGPTLGPNVSIGTGAKVLGPAKVGESAKVGANAVVLKDVAAFTTVVGIPARVVRDRSKETLGAEAAGAAIDAASSDMHGTPAKNGTGAE